MFLRFLSRTHLCDTLRAPRIRALLLATPFAALALLSQAALAAAQSAVDPITGTWSGRIGPSAEPNYAVMLELRLDGTSISHDPSTGTLHIGIARANEDAASLVSTASRYRGLRPVATARTFGQIAGHIADAHLYYCGRAAGCPVQWPDAIAEGPAEKPQLMAKLNDAAAQCSAAFEAGNMGPLVANWHYRNLVTYLRLPGFIPPTSG